MNEEFKWIEVWVDSCSFEYVLILKALESGLYEIYDPVKKSTLIRFNKLEEAMYWLGEDEYERVLGRHPVNPLDMENDGYFNELIGLAMEVHQLRLKNENPELTRENIVSELVASTTKLSNISEEYKGMDLLGIPVDLEQAVASSLRSIFAIARLYDIEIEGAFYDNLTDMKRDLNEKNEPE